MKIIFLPGVGFNRDNEEQKRFLEKISKETKAECEIYNWKKSYDEYFHSENLLSELPYGKLRHLFSKITLDFQNAIKNNKTIPVPDADIYLGHSAGSIIALCQNKSCILFGSPAYIIEDFRFTDFDFNNVMFQDRSILNIVHENDIIAFPLNIENVENFIFSGSKLSIKNYYPISAHSSYWTSPKVISKTVDTILKWH